jgi:hypothetical protein
MEKGSPMLDVTLLLGAAGFFAIAILYAARLRRNVRPPCPSITSSARSWPVVITVYLVYVAGPTRAVLGARHDQPMAGCRSRSFAPIIIAAHAAARRLHDARLQRRAHPISRPVLQSDRARDLLGAAASTKSTEQHWLTYAVSMLLFSLAGVVALYVLQRLPGRAAVQSSSAVRARLRKASAFNTSRSASPPTPTGSPTPARRR